MYVCKLNTNAIFVNKIEKILLNNVMSVCLDMAQYCKINLNWLFLKIWEHACLISYHVNMLQGRENTNGYCFLFTEQIAKLSAKCQHCKYLCEKYNLYKCLNSCTVLILNRFCCDRSSQKASQIIFCLWSHVQWIATTFEIFIFNLYDYFRLLIFV